MVMGHNWKGASYGRATDGDLELGAAARAGTSARPRPAPVCARALRRAVEDRRRDVSACGRATGPVEAARSRYRLRLAGPLPGRRPGGADGPPPWWLPPEPASTTWRGPRASRWWVRACTSRRARNAARNWAWHQRALHP